ncbi:MAG: DNA helicase RecQ [Acidobacteriota bacterium]
MPDPAEDSLRRALREVWGYDAFRPLQREAISAILAGRDSLVVLPTGGGKSLCFQAPALLRPGLGLVVSPLIALMKDQVDGLRADGVAAAALHSGLDTAERERVLGELAGGRLRLLYAAPERVVGEGGAAFRRQLARAGLWFVAVDEAHCISQWGHDFRPEYRQLRALREEFPQVGLHAFTATATPRVRRDIAAELGLRQPEILVGSFDRANLVYRGRRRASLYRQVLEAVRRHSGEGGIVYALSRREVEQLATRLQADGVRALPYHAGLPDAVRGANQDAFLDERCDVIVATVAFGMGIDRSNVRFVVHAGAPRSLEHYQQESGRAGRDGLSAECLLLHSPADGLRWRRLMEASGELPPGALELLRQMERYAAGVSCRHRVLAEYFGDSYPAASCGACDRCLGELESLPDALVVAQKILSCVLRVRESFGAAHLIDVLRGRSTERVVANGHDRLSTFGLLAETSVDELRGYVEQLVEQGFLESDGERYPVLRVTAEGRSLLRGGAAPQLLRQRPPEPRRRPAPSAGELGTDDDQALFEALRRERLAIAQERGVPPYVVFHDTTLRNLARRRPASVRDLLAVHGVGQKKADDLGERFLRVIREHALAD